jgi:hypothetical protein
MRIRPLAQASWELWSLGLILALYLGANVGINAARPRMLSSALASVDSLLVHDRSLLDADLQRWRAGVLDNGRWLAQLVGVALEARTPDDRLSAADLSRLHALTVTQVPTARVWVLDANGRLLGSTSAGPPNERQRHLALASLARDSTLMAATELKGHDLRLSVASPVRSAAGRGLISVLDISASDQLRRQLPRLAWEGHTGRAAVTFPFDAAFVGATWSGKTGDPEIGWPASGWSLDDPSLIVVGGTLSDTLPRFELAIPRSAAAAIVETRVARLRLGATLVTLALCVGVLLVGRTRQRRTLREASASLADSELRAAQAEAAATRAQLAASQARINPHFLSNALHSVSALVATDPEAAEDALDQLGDLFRYSLDRSGQQMVRLEDEWRFVCDYLAIEQMRFGDRLELDMSCAGDLARRLVPTFILQPLVENAIRHGIAPRPSGGRLTVRAERAGERLVLIVQDDGVGADPAAVSTSRGTGLRTLAERLALDQALDGRMEVRTRPGEGFRVTVSVGQALIPNT